MQLPIYFATQVSTIELLLLNSAQVIIFLHCKIQQQRRVRPLEYTYTMESCKQFTSY